MTATIRLTTAEALVRWMVAQRSELLDGTEVPLFAGVFAIFGHGNVLGLGPALHAVRDRLPTWRGQAEEGMALAAVAYAKAMDRRQVMAVTTSVGPGALNMVTAAGTAMANRLPVLLLPGDTFAGRAPDPVLQQVEHFGDLTTSVNDAFRAVSRSFDRIVRPEQLIAALPQVARVLTDPADAGPVVLALPQDVQAEAFDFPEAMFAPRLHRVPRPRPDARALDAAAATLRGARRPLLVLGGGARYSGAGATAVAFAERHGVPVVDTPAGRTLLPHAHRLYGGPLGIIGSASANALAADADVALVVGSRLQDFATASWTVFSPTVRLVHLNAARFDAVKHAAEALVGDARAGLEELDARLDGFEADATWSARAAEERARWDAGVDRLRAGGRHPGRKPDLRAGRRRGQRCLGAGRPRAHLVGRHAGRAARRLAGRRTGRGATSGATMDLEYGFSCMGYELSGAWGAAMAHAARHPGGLVTSLLGDGSST